MWEGREMVVVVASSSLRLWFLLRRDHRHHRAMAVGRAGLEQLNRFLNDPMRLVPPSLHSGHALRHLSDVTGSASGGKRLFVNDTLSLVRRLEAQDLNAKQAEGITSAITQVLNGSLESVAQSFSTKGEMLNSEMIREAALSKFKGEIQGSQENHFTTLRNETEKLCADIDKMRSEFRYEVDKVASAQRLDLNLERGRIRDELASQTEETQNLTNKLDKEIHALRTQVEAAKYDVIKYCIGTIVSVTALGLAVLRILI